MIWLTGSVVVFLASAIAVLINDYTPFGGKDLDEKLATEP
jgi:hypothetical protein